MVEAEHLLEIKDELFGGKLSTGEEKRKDNTIDTDPNVGLSMDNLMATLNPKNWFGNKEKTTEEK